MDSAQSWIRNSLISLVLVGLAGLVVAQARGTRAGPTEPAWASFAWLAPEQRAVLAHQRLSDSEVPGGRHAAQSLAEEALKDSPLVVSAVRILARLAELEGRNQAINLALIAAERQPTHAGAQLWLADYYLKTGDYQQALERINLTLQHNADRLPQLLPALSALAQDDRTSDTLVAILASNPSWRASLFWHLGFGANTVDLASNLLARLKERGASPTSKEFSPLIDRLVAEQQFERAYMIWVSFLPQERASKLAYISNGHFDHSPDGTPFDWTISSGPGTWAHLATLPGSEADKRLSLQFSEARAPFVSVTQTILVPPGRYMLSIKAKADDLETEKGLWWRIYCLNGKPLGATRHVAGTMAAQTQTADFIVPEEGCPVQRLQLELAARGSIERQISGSVWFDDIQIRRAD